MKLRRLAEYAGGGSDERGLHILFVHHGGDWIRGSEACLLTLVDSQIQRGNKCTVVANSPVLLAQAQAYGATVMQLKVSPSGEYLPSQAAIREVLSVLKNAKPSLVHLNSPEYVKRFVSCCIALNIPTIYHAHSIQPLSEHRWAWIPIVTRIVSCGVTAARSLDGHQLQGRRVATILNGIRVAPASPRSDDRKREVLRARPDVPAILFAGSLIERKRPADAIRAVAGIPNVQLSIAGSGSEESSLRQLTDDLGLTNRVHFLGDRNDVPELLAQADMYLAPSGWEALPLGVAEAAGIGLPIVASDIGPHQELLHGYHSKNLYRVGDQQALTAAILVTLKSRLGADFGSLEASEVRERYSIDRYIAEFDSTYHKMFKESTLSRSAVIPDASQLAALILRRNPS